MNDLGKIAIQKLQDRGVTIESIAELVVEAQKNYNVLTLEESIHAVMDVIRKGESTHAILVAIALDELAEKNALGKEISEIINNDQGTFGLDEILALSIVNMYGSIALTNFGYLDKTKPGIIGKIDMEGKQHTKCHTFLDDIVGAIAASAISKLAHKKTSN